jgi:hypothetical protein
VISTAIADIFFNNSLILSPEGIKGVIFRRERDFSDLAINFQLMYVLDSV